MTNPGGYNGEPTTHRLEYIDQPSRRRDPDATLAVDRSTSWEDLTAGFRNMASVGRPAPEYQVGRAGVPLEALGWRNVKGSTLSKGANVGPGQYATVRAGDRRGWWMVGDARHTQRLVGVLGLSSGNVTCGIMALRRRSDNTLNEDLFLLVRLELGGPTRDVAVIPRVSDAQPPITVGLDGSGEVVVADMARGVTPAYPGFRLGVDFGQYGPEIMVMDAGSPGGRTQVMVPKEYTNPSSQQAFGGVGSALDPTVALQYLEYGHDLRPQEDPWSNPYSG